MKKAYSFRIYPNKKHEAKLNRTLTTCRHLYNDALAERRKHAELYRLKREFGVFPWGGFEWISYENQASNLARSKTQEQKEVYSQVLQNTLKRLDRSFVNFYNGFELDIEEEEIKLSKIGVMRVVLHREIEGKIKTCTVKKDVDQWYVIFTVEIDREIEPVELKTKIGVDVGLASLLTLSNGDQIKPPEYFRKSEKKLAKEQVRLSRKKKGSKNRQKQRIEVAKVHRKIRNQRKDFAHGTSKQLVNKYDHIVFEDLQIRNMVQNHHLAKSISDAGWYQLISFTKSKAGEAGKIVELVNPKYTSQVCICGYPVPKDLSVRIHSCPHCGLVIGRDHVSAMIILNRSTAGTAGIEACKSGLSRDTMKQEATLLVGW